MESYRSANVIGLGLIGGSIALGLRRRGWKVSGSDLKSELEATALERGIIDVAGLDSSAAITFVATPVMEIASGITTALERTSGLVTDVGSVKSLLVDEFPDERYIGSHPMAGSELDGL
ncbi:MAG: prephenate dehydrogenase/arogenate dehydrogenase family protein, partial [Actinobacteria bacterium]|nr:prephenate dehydrogenase/arogenate dehydrogenase family protein [Actinomycetota bacterium]